VADEKNEKSKSHGKGARPSFYIHFILLANPGIHPRNPLKRIYCDFEKMQSGNSENRAEIKVFA
jgi:hypothetical protein